MLDSGPFEASSFFDSDLAILSRTTGGDVLITVKASFSAEPILSFPSSYISP